MLSVGERVYDHATIVALCRGVFERGGLMALRVHGRSMHPAIHDGALVRVGAVDYPIRLGTVVLAEIGPTMVLHRVLWRHGAKVLVRGDANLHADGWFAASELVAMVVARHDGSRWRTESALRRFACWVVVGIRHTIRLLYHRIRP